MEESILSSGDKDKKCWKFSATEGSSGKDIKVKESDDGKFIITTYSWSNKSGEYKSKETVTVSETNPLSNIVQPETENPAKEELMEAIKEMYSK